MTEEKRIELEEEIKNLEASKEGMTFMEKMDVSTKIHNVSMQLNGVKPTDSHFDCVGCGS
jgi:hypothetical protein